jgi:cell division protein FtsI/penicillin-binding protein 2
MKWRIFLLIFLVFTVYSFLLAKIYAIQINKNDIYVKLARSQELMSSVFVPQRGNIYFTDKNNNDIPAALNKEYNVIFAMPNVLQAEAQKGGKSLISVAQSLSGLVGKSVGELEKQLSKKDDQYELLIAKATDEEVEKIKQLNIKGIYFTKKDFRFYPSGKLASHLLGFVSRVVDEKIKQEIEIGRYGVELFFNKDLTGSFVAADYKAKFQGDLRGKDIKLTIDRNIQAQAEEMLKSLVEKWKAAGGTIIVQDPKTGKILALANFPDFDPNSYWKYEVKNFLNPAVESIYEPGSIFKVLTMAIGLDSNKVTPETTYVDNGSFTANGMTIHNWDFKTHGPYGRINMSNIIEKSVNTGAVFVERQIGHRLFYDYLVKFGLSELTGISLPGEIKGNLNTLKNGRDIDFATAAYGQGVAVTPLALINAVSVIANGGVLMRPYILQNEKPKIIRRVIEEKTAKEVVKMMVSAVDKAKVAKIANYSIAGKTGTAFIPIFGGKGYSSDTINSFVGFAPAYDPQFIALIKLDKVPGSPLAGLTVVPAFKEFAQFMINYYNIKPDRLNKEE